MKHVSKAALITFVVTSFAFASCDSKPAAEQTGNTVTEDMVDGAGTSIDSVETGPDSMDAQ